MGRSGKHHGSRGRKGEDGHDGAHGEGHRSGGHSGGGSRGDGSRGDDHRRGGDGDGGRRGARGDEDQRRRERVRDEVGRYAERVDHDDVLGVFDAVEGPVVTTTDVGDVLGITTEAARGKLNDLVGEGVLRRRKTGRTVVYWQTGERDDNN